MVVKMMGSFCCHCSDVLLQMNIVTNANNAQNIHFLGNISREIL